MDFIARCHCHCILQTSKASANTYWKANLWQLISNCTLALLLKFGNSADLLHAKHLSLPSIHVHEPILIPHALWAVFVYLSGCASLLQGSGVTSPQICDTDHFCSKTNPGAAPASTGVYCNSSCWYYCYMPSIMVHQHLAWGSCWIEIYLAPWNFHIVCMGYNCQGIWICHALLSPLIYPWTKLPLKTNVPFRMAALKELAFRKLQSESFYSKVSDWKWLFFSRSNTHTYTLIMGGYDAALPSPDDKVWAWLSCAAHYRKRRQLKCTRCWDLKSAPSIHIRKNKVCINTALGGMQHLGGCMQDRS